MFLTPDLELVQGDTCDIAAVLMENNVPINLTGAEVTLYIQNGTGSISYNLCCTLGANVNGTIIYATEGGITIPFTHNNTSNHGRFWGQFSVNVFGKIITYPNNKYISINIIEKL